ncbi:hypothetical protein GCM10010912_09440 [Paenibacillus albidus]|uniref:Response regulator n=1 Tax=Paenibacillus albidus TaxID=2041023 RepID=A0A917FC02_9BACL|nr:response regulator [Paenibacillus albidus]GGF66558.1 hypothetical protein GCM10010912_09440 [Paenibacillus albidus]
MLTMIIADDEPFIRSSLVHVFDWPKEFGIEIVAEAADGQEAYELCLKHQPDILFTDIMMPLLDGLQVAEKLRAAGCPTKIIIISGAQDFAYARNALKVNAEGYILKPVKLPEVRELFTQVIARLAEEQGNQKNMERLRRQLQDNLPLIRDKFLHNLITGLYRSEQEIWDKIDFFNLPVKRQDYVTVGVLQLDDYQTAVDKFSEEHKQLLYFSILNIIDECLNSSPCGLCFVANENEFILLFCRTEDLNVSFLTGICEQISSSIKQYLQLAVSIGIGRNVPQLTRVEESYKDALQALVYKFYTGSGAILFIQDIEPDTQTLQSTFFYKFHAQLMNELKIGNTAKVTALLEQLFAMLTKPKLPIDYVQSICAEIIFTSARTLYEIDEGIVHDRMSIMETLYRKKNINELKTYMLRLFSDLTAQVESRNTTRNSSTVQKIKAIIQTGYAGELPISRIAEEVYLTPNYISLIFKKETGETLTDYLTRIRLGKAKELLQTTDLKVMEISEKVGYENPHYFSTVFKKNVGVHPLKYRSDHSKL